MSTSHVVPTVPGAPAVAAVPGTYAFHRLQRTRPGVRWWRPLLVGLVALALYAVLLVVGGVALVAAGALWGPGPLEVLEQVALLRMRDPWTFAATMLSIVVMLPAVLVAARLLGARPVGLLWSVAGRPRWAWAARCLAASVAITGVVTAGDVVVATLQGEPWEPRVDAVTVPFLLLAVLLVPVQCVAEEVVFRGYLVQTVGSWLRHPAFAVVLPVPLFVLGHTYVGLAMLDTAVWALAMGWLVWRTGGLEAAAAAHVVNNLLVFGLGAFDLVDLDLVDVPLDAFAVSTVTTLLYVGVVEVLARRTGIARVRVVPAQVAPGVRALPDGGPGAVPTDPWAVPSARP